MARPLRVEYEGAYYHVMNRGQGRQRVFHGKRYYMYFLLCLEQAHKRFALEVHAYCLMGNHYHLLVRTPRGNLSRSMRHINGVYTQHYNFLKGTDGPLFRGRYKAINIEASSHLLQVSRYIHRNPAETSKPLVGDLELYQWSSYPAYRKLVENPEWLYKDSVLGEVSSGQSAAQYRRYIEAGNDNATEQFYAKNQWPAVRGSEGFMEDALRHSNSSSPEVGRGRYRNEIESSEILALVASHFDCDEIALLKAKRGRGVDNTARALAMKLCQECGSMRLADMGELFGVNSDSGVTKSIGRLTERMSKDSKLLSLYNVLCQDLTP